MANTIPNETVPAPVIQFNNHYYLVDGQYAPRTLNIPCGINALLDDQQWWAVPVKNYGIVADILQMVPAINGNVAQPTPDSISVIRIRDKYNPGYTWWVVCTLAQYYASCAACCDDPVVPIPDPTLPTIVPCQILCDGIDDDGNYYAVFAAPALGAGQEYQTFGEYDGESLDAFESDDLDDLIIDLNANYGTVGSPAVDIVWTRIGTTIIGTVQDGNGEDNSICLLIKAIEESP